jgi:hypothetical protein
MKTWTDQHLQHELDNFKIELFQSVDSLRKLLSEVNIGLGDDCWVQDYSHILETLYYRDIFKCIHWLLAHLPCQAYLILEPVCLTDPESHTMHSKTDRSDWWLDTRDPFTAKVMIVPVICACNKTD